MPLHGNQVRRARFGDNEDSVLTASRDRTARTWKVDTGGPRATFAGHTETVTAAVFIPGDRIATASEDGTVRTWVAQLQPPLQPARSMPAPRRSIDPRATVTGSVVTLRIHGRVVTLEGHRDDVLSVEVSRDGSRVVTASKDGDARIWDARTGETVCGAERALRHCLRRFLQPERTLGRHRRPDDRRPVGRGDAASASSSSAATEARSSLRRSPRRRASSPAARTAFARTFATPAAASAHCSRSPSGGWPRPTASCLPAERVEYLGG